jgi:hypothetical protein
VLAGPSLDELDQRRLGDVRPARAQDVARVDEDEGPNAQFSDGSGGMVATSAKRPP